MFMLLISLAYLPGYGQQAAGSYLLSGGMDLTRTDAPGVIRRYQLGAELNYFYLHSLSFFGGYEINYDLYLSGSADWWERKAMWRWVLDILII